MPPAARHEILFEPVTIGPKTLRNRFYQVPHATGYGTLKPSSLAAYRASARRADGAAVNMEWAPVSESTDEWPGITARHVGQRGRAPAGDRRSIRCTPTGRSPGSSCTTAARWRCGASRAGTRCRRRASAASCPRRPGSPRRPRRWIATTSRPVQQAFVDAAVRARDAGFDIVYVYAGCGYPMAQFLSPFHNKRTDEYGGSRENRARMWVEKLTRVRAAVGADCAIATRIAAETDGPWGHDIDDTSSSSGLADGLVDLWDVNVGSYLNMDPTSRRRGSWPRATTPDGSAGARGDREAHRRRGAVHRPRRMADVVRSARSTSSAPRGSRSPTHSSRRR